MFLNFREYELGGLYGSVLPDPIPNSEVKGARADDTLAFASGKVGSCPLYEKTLLTESFFVSGQSARMNP